ncbi:PapB/FocB family fimbrial expression transcriptional regulator [Citrobacter meridianamericanus]|uniref:PapB/FocB family fimbrial expression transcriptional regulator n=1 Tax=Citrobacter meridianamericanus TaxID=2894201 RepID=UPI00351CC48F
MKIKSLNNSGSRLYPGEVTEEQFQLIIDISPLRSSKVINALRGYFVQGFARKIVCDKYNVNPGYLSVKINEIHLLHSRIIGIYTFLIHYNQSSVVQKNDD